MFHTLRAYYQHGTDHSICFQELKGNTVEVAGVDVES